MYQMSDAEFGQVVEEALDSMPQQFLDALRNVAVTVQDEPDDYQLGALDDPGFSGGTEEGGELLGLFDGLSIVERADGYDDDLPDVITIFKGPHERCFQTREEEVAQVRKTVIHEIGHYYGLDDARLHEMGY